ncbi:MAG TPA: DUF3224 domain-containing protein [Steroidobacteraceae bacterium]
MTLRTHLMLGLAAASLLAAYASTSQENLPMHASGYFDVTLTPQAADNPPVRTAQIERLSIDKKYHGDVQGTSAGQMQAMRDERDTGAYVALEKVVASIQGRKGTFMLMHYGYMNEGAVGRWLVEIVPDSGTGELAGLSGTMKIIQKDDKHYYEIEYALPKP